MMKENRIAGMALAALVAAPLFAGAAVPPTVNFTADGVHGMQLFLRGATASNPAWTELHAREVDLVNHRGCGREDDIYYFNSRLEPETFASMDDLSRWQQVLAKRFWKDPLKAQHVLTLREDGDSFRFYFNGAYLTSMPRYGASASTMSFKPDRDFPLSVEYRFEKADERFEKVDITERANAIGMPGRNRKAADTGKVVERDGIPFQLSRDGNDNIDLSMSWNPAAFRTGFTACYSAQRWPNPLYKIPLRYQFRVPGRDYDAMYVLCATDGKKANSIPRFSVQFYRWRTGFFMSHGRPFTFASETVPVSTNGDLFVVKVPLSGDLISEFGPETFLNFELTKDVFPYRTYADPLNHSWHAGGLPSAVRVYGITLRKAPIRCEVEPLQTANIFGEDEQVGYRVTMENTTAEPYAERISAKALDWYGKDPLDEDEKVKLAPGERKSVVLELDPERFGWYQAEITAGGRTWKHNFVRLRKREYDVRPFDEKCIRAGVWKMLQRSTLMAYIAGKGGWDTEGGGIYYPSDPEERKKFEETMRRFGMRTFVAPSDTRATYGGRVNAATPIDEGVEAFLKRQPDLAKHAEDEFRQYKYVTAMAEPGGINAGNAEFPEYWGEPENAYDCRKIAGKERERFLDYKRMIQISAKALRGRFPGLKLLMPHGSWTFMIPFLQDPETRECSDGVQCDFQYYTRLPEMQLHQSALNSLMLFKDAWHKYRKGEPILLWDEGPDVTQVYPGGSSQIGAASHRVRISMLMAAYGCNIQCSWATSAISTGENHCSAGLVVGSHALDPDLHYAAFSAWLRHVRHATHESFTDPGSTSAFCQNFRDHRKGNLIRAVWTIRGERDFVFDCDPDDLTVYDPMDNVVEAEERDGKAVVRAGEMPVFVYGAEGAAVTLGEPGHSDACQPQLGRDFWSDPVVVKLANLGETAFKQTDEADKPYVEMMPSYIRRFPVKMEVAQVESERGRALSVGLGKQEKDRMTMPYTTCIRFEKPIAIPGKAQALRLDVKAASDWGRVVYVLKDAAGRRWYSCGRAGDWNGDDMEGESTFCFDGWRTLRFELPFHEPWDNYRNVGFTNWGSDGKLEDKVTLPVALEKIFVERRNGVIYGCEFRRFEKDTPVLLGTLAAEYAKEEDQTPAVYAAQKIQAPKASVSSLPNPIADFAKAGTLPAGRITGVKDPETWFDGTRGVFSYEMPTNAVSAEMWMSLNPEGRGALLLGKNLKGSSAQVSGFLADTDFWAFLIWKDKDGNISKPSEPFKFKLIDHFGHQ